MGGNNTGLLTARCDPYGAESRISLQGGMYPESHVGRIMWHCDNRAVARFRMVCRGGEYGQRTGADGGIVAAFSCPGGHRGQVMPLCAEHRAEIQRRQAGLCPRCAYPPQARGPAEQLEGVQRIMQTVPPWDLPRLAKLISLHDQLAAQMTDLSQRGIVHRCPLLLTEVS